MPKTYNDYCENIAIVISDFNEQRITKTIFIQKIESIINQIDDAKAKKEIILNVDDNLKLIAYKKVMNVYKQFSKIK